MKRSLTTVFLNLIRSAHNVALAMGVEKLKDLRNGGSFRGGEAKKVPSSVSGSPN